MNTKQKGFTLIELLVVVAIIGLLATIVTVSLGSARARARDARRVADMGQIETALNLYYSDNSEYPAGLEDLVPATGTKYLRGVRVDAASGVPVDGQNVEYQYVVDDATDPQAYHVWIDLETTADSDLMRQAANCDSIAGETDITGDTDVSFDKCSG